MRNILHRFAEDRGGNFALMTSILVVPLDEPVPDDQAEIWTE